MKGFYEKWKSDKKYRTKIKLLAYVIFFVTVSIYALSLRDEYPENSAQTPITPTVPIEAFNIPDNYTYTANVTINDNEYEYFGEKDQNKKTIVKKVDDIITEYLYQDNEYYILIDSNYLKTTREEVYDIVNYNYLNLENINIYLSKATKNSNQYLVYIKDIILGNDSEDYFTILVNDNNINIDYTPLVKCFDSNIEKYKIDINIEKRD